MGAKEFHETMLKRCAQCGEERWRHENLISDHEFVDPDKEKNMVDPEDFLTLTLKPWQVLDLSVEEFLIGMSSLGTPQEIQMVGAFADPNDMSVRTAHRDIDLPLHRDGIYTKAIADMQDGNYVERPNVDMVGMYCVRDNDAPCYTTISEDGVNIDHEIDLRAGQALVWDNRLWHGRRGPVGKRLLIRFWVTCPEVRG